MIYLEVAHVGEPQEAPVGGDAEEHALLLALDHYLRGLGGPEFCLPAHLTVRERKKERKKRM